MPTFVIALLALASLAASRVRHARHPRRTSAYAHRCADRGARTRARGLHDRGAQRSALRRHDRTRAPHRSRHYARQRCLPDLIVLLGDYALSHTRLRTMSRWLYEWALPQMTATLRTLRARDGVIAILGNHDYDHDATKVVEWLRSTGARVLVNECVVVARGNAQLGIGGVDDWTHGRIDPAGGCASLAPDIPRIVLSHNPDGALELASTARVDLVLAGHTHGGQIVLPWFGAPSRHCIDMRCAIGERLGRAIAGAALRHHGRRRRAATAHQLSSGSAACYDSCARSARATQQPVCALVQRSFQLPSACRSSSAYAFDSYPSRASTRSMCGGAPICTAASTSELSSVSSDPAVTSR